MCGLIVSLRDLTHLSYCKWTHLFKLNNRIKYSDFVSEGGNKPFKDVDGGASSYIIVLRPGINLDALEQCYKVEEKY